MTELQSRHIVDAYDVYAAEPWKEQSQIYLKTEADRVIAEKDKIIDDQKRKRCLAMANYWVAASYHCVDDKHRQNAERHHRKWLELANKFEEPND